MKIAFFILTSSNSDLLKEAYNSVCDQRNHTINYNIFIVVNSLQPGYYQEVINTLGNNIYKGSDNNPPNGALINIISTKSNGLPGQGHQSCVDLFREHISSEYTHCMILDGDDVIYPSTFHQIQKLTKIFNSGSINNLDYILTQSNERVTLNETQYTLSNNLYYDTLADVNHNRWLGINIQNPKNTHISACGTLTRMLIFSRRIFEYGYNELFYRNMKLHDDYLTFLVGTDIFLRKLKGENNLDMTIVPSTYIYLYNSINDASMTHNSKNYEYQFDHELLMKDSGKYEFFNTWDFSKLPFTTLSSPAWYSMKDKWDFAQKFATKYINILQKQADESFSQVQSQNNIGLTLKCKELYRRLIKNHGVISSKNYLNYGVINFRLGNIGKSVKYLIKIVKLHKNGRETSELELAIKNLFIIWFNKKYPDNIKQKLENIIEYIKIKNVFDFNKHSDITRELLLIS
jgi:hypothetical protein